MWLDEFISISCQFITTNLPHPTGYLGNLVHPEKAILDITSSTLEQTAENLQYITLDQYSGIHYPNSYERLYQKTNLKEN